MRLAVFDVGGTFIKAALMEDEQIVRQAKVPTPKTSQKDFLEAVASLLETMDDAQGIAFSLPGVIDSENRRIITGGALDYNAGTNLNEWEKDFRLPVEAENDARCSALGELKSGALAGVKNGMVLVFGTGVGSALVLNGEIYPGSHLAAGETSMVLTDIPDTVDYSSMFGLKGSASAFVSQQAEEHELEPDDGIGVFEIIQNQNPQAVQAFEAYCRNIAFQIFNLQCVLDLECIAIGGGISQNPLFAAEVERQYKKIYEEFHIGHPQARIAPARYGNNANLIGAYHHFLDRQARHGTKGTNSL